MNNLAALYRYELKKTVERKATLIIFAVLFALLAALNITEYFAASKAPKCDDSMLVGRTLDDELFTEMREGISPNIMTDSLGNEEIENVSYDNGAYRHLFQYLLNCTGNCTRAYNITKAQLNNTFNEITDTAYDSFKLSDKEISYWENRRETVVMPPKYDKSAGWSNSIVNLYIANFFILIAIAGSLSGIFADEYKSKTASIVSASSNGRERLAYAKILAGCSIGLIEALLIIIGNCASQFILYGSSDFDASIQLVYGPSLLDMPARKAFLICFGIMLAISLFYSIFTMLLSQLFKSTTIPIAVMAVVLICSMLNPPNEYRFISQLASYMPATFPGSWTFTDYRLISFFGLKMTIFDVLPVLYGILSIAFALLIYLSSKKSCRN